MFPKLISSDAKQSLISHLKKPIRNGLIAGIVMAIISLFIPNQYRSEARILPGDSKGSGGLGQMAAAAAVMGVSVPGGDSGDAAFADVLKSRRIQKELLQEKYLFRTRSFYFGKWREREETLYQFLKAKNMDRALVKMKKIISVNRDLKTKLLTVAAETESPELSQQLVIKAVENLEKFVQTKGRTKGGAKAIFASERLKEAQSATMQAEREFVEFLNVHRNFATSNDPGIRMRGARMEATLKMRQQVVATLVINHEQALMEEKNDMPILNVLDDGDLPMEKSWPARSNMVLVALVLVAIMNIGWENQGRLRAFLR